MGDIDRGEVFAACDDPFQQRLRLPGSEKCVDENSVSLAGDEGGGVRYPHQIWIAVRQITTQAWTFYREHFPRQDSLCGSHQCLQVRSVIPSSLLKRLLSIEHRVWSNAE